MRNLGEQSVQRAFDCHGHHPRGELAADALGLAHLQYVLDDGQLIGDRVLPEVLMPRFVSVAAPDLGDREHERVWVR